MYILVVRSYWEVYIHACFSVLYQMEEFVTLADPKLCVLSDGMEMEVTELPQHKITDFT